MSRIEALRECMTITRREARNFHHGLRLLPARPRLALYAVYAWMRVLDDLADEPGGAADERRARIDRFEEATRAVLDGGDAAGRDGREIAVLDGIAFVAAEFPIDRSDLFDAIEGQRMDLEPRVYRDRAETETYCDRVASTVGRICLDVWGARDGADRARARTLSTARGIAFQLVNILRDVREDHARGRCYLPADELAAHGLSAGDLVAWTDDARCAAFMRAQCARAEAVFDESAELERLVAPRAVPTLAAMSVIYRRILARIARDPRGALARRVSLPAHEKLSIGLRARFGLLSHEGGGRG
jgi:phytoene synthase